MSEPDLAFRKKAASLPLQGAGGGGGRSCYTWSLASAHTGKMISMQRAFSRLYTVTDFQSYNTTVNENHMLTCEFVRFFF